MALDSVESKQQTTGDGATTSPSQILLHDSMVTVRLSEPPALTLDTSNLSKGIPIPIPIQEEAEGLGLRGVDTGDEGQDEETEESPRITMIDPNGNEVPSPTDEEIEGEEGRGSVSSDGEEEEEEGGGVNWEELQQTEEKEPRSETSDDSTAMLLARLEQENNLLATNPKSGIAKVQIQEKQINGNQSRPPSIQHLKRLVNGPTPPALRYSMLPAPPMTDLEFYAALVQDYSRTAQCLPTLLSKKIRSGVPPPLRGVVWQSMSGARDRVLEDQFDRLCGESSPYEGIIGKDLGRSFPGVDMFREPDGEGQQMLGRVLRCFSLYDHKIGYCQGLGFLVGPLLMHMGDKQAFCVLVRLMEHYDLRSCFLPDLSGLHVRIYQFRELLKQHLPKLSNHLDVLQVEPAYVSQWFLSFFAVTCPLPMLFRIYDVIFAEGASATLMRVALSLMRKNEEKMMACTEFEDVMQILLSRGLWDVYHYNADEFVNDFVSLTGVVTHESLQALEVAYKEAQAADVVSPSENVGSAASRFLGRLWAGSNSSTKSMTLSPSVNNRPVSFLRRSPSKQSIASTLNSMEGGGSDSMLSTSTDATSISRDSSNTDNSSLRAQSSTFTNTSNGQHKMSKDKNLHSQIEDLLMALSEMQRDHAVLATELQKEREDREEDKQVVRSLLDSLRKKTSLDTMASLENGGNLDTVKVPAVVEVVEVKGEDDEDGEVRSNSDATQVESINQDPEEELSQLLDVVEERFKVRPESRRSSMLQSKSQMRDELARAKESLIIEVSKTQAFSRQIQEHQQEIQNLKDQVKEGHVHIRNAHQDKQRLERQIHELRASRKSAASTPDGSRDEDSAWPAPRSSATSGLREFKLGRSNSSRSQAPSFTKRTSSLTTRGEADSPIASPPNEPSKQQDQDNDALVLELVQAKTAEAIAKQEAEEAKAKLESLRKMLGMSGSNTPAAAGLGDRNTPSQATIERSQTSLGVSRNNAPTKVDIPTPTSAVGGFWGGWGKRTLSGEKSV